MKETWKRSPDPGAVRSANDADRSRFLASRRAEYQLAVAFCPRTRVHAGREAALYAGPFICVDKMQIGSASARGPASICHGDATQRYRLARPWNYSSRARILQRTPVIYRALDSRHAAVLSSFSFLHFIYSHPFAWTFFP